MSTDLSALLQTAMQKVAELNENGMKLGNKRYTTVAVRVETFRKVFGMRGRIRTEMLHADAETVVMQAHIEFLHDGQWHEYANGYAEEKRGSSQVNRTSAVENCESSAVGRALANMGLHGGEYASANEVENAIHQQGQPDKKPARVALVSDKTDDRPVYPDDKFSTNFDNWRGAIATGKKTPQSIISTISAKYILSDAQKAAISACDIGTPPVLPEGEAL